MIRTDKLKAGDIFLFSGVHLSTHGKNEIYMISNQTEFKNLEGPPYRREQKHSVMNHTQYPISKMRVK